MNSYKTTPLVILLFLSQCISSVSLAKDALYSQYEIYDKEYTRENYLQRFNQFFVKDLLDGLDHHSEEIKEQLYFKDSIKEVVSHKEIIYKDTGCLLLTTKDINTELFTAQLGYALENRIWKVNQIHFHLEEDEKDLPTEPICTVIKTLDTDY